MATGKIELIANDKSILSFDSRQKYGRFYRRTSRKWCEIVQLSRPKNSSELIQSFISIKYSGQIVNVLFPKVKLCIAS